MQKKELNIFHFGRSVAGFLLLIFVAYYANITLFMHYHVVDGVTIVHSHIFSSDHTEDPENSNHTTTELTLIAFLSNFIADVAELQTTLSEKWSYYYNNFVVVSQQVVFAHICSLTQLRAPPCDIIFG
ncbi:MAG: hypothetical protein SNF68_07590 [Rikenellaceae bacterium]